MSAKVQQWHGGVKNQQLNQLATAYMAGKPQFLILRADFLDECYRLDLPPCYVLRQFLGSQPLSLNKKLITEILRNPQSTSNLIPLDLIQKLLEHYNVASPDATAQNFLSRLAIDIQNCVDCDSNYGPASDIARHTAGNEYEVKLYEALDAAGIAYSTEQDLRDTGHHKTPDVRLVVPIAVKGRVVCWIDSKATFGDERQHATYREKQYQTYANRYGSGMVIYWHGYLAELQNLEENVVLMDRFPAVEDDVVTLPQLPLTIAGVSSLSLSVGKNEEQGENENRR